MLTATQLQLNWARLNLEVKPEANEGARSMSVKTSGGNMETEWLLHHVTYFNNSFMLPAAFT